MVETLPRPSGPHLTAPVRYSYDADVSGAGVYRYYVVLVDNAGEERTASGTIGVNVETGSVNHEPVAALKVTPAFAGAPAEITLDASNSYDVDGDVLVFAWDFDADGTVDWVSTDAVPEQSSTGLAVDITPGAVPGLVTARYTRGSAEWYYPLVTAVDTEGAESLPASAKLGLSGWVNTVLNESLDDYLISVYASLIDIDPKTGRKVLVASSTLPPLNGEEYRRSLFYSVENADGTWTTEELPMSVLTGDINELILLEDVVWDEYLEPIILFQYSNSVHYWAWTAQHSSAGTWNIQKCFPGDDPEYFDHSWIHKPGSYSPGQFASVMYESLTDKPNSSGGSWHAVYYILFYDHGEWSIEYIGYDTADSYRAFGGSTGYNQDNLLCYFTVTGDITDGSWAAHWEDGALGEPFRIDDGILSFEDPTYCRENVLGDGGTRYTIWADKTGVGPINWLLVNTATDFASYNLTTLGLQEGFYTGLISGLYAQNNRIGLFQFASGEDTDIEMYQHMYLENGKWIREAFQSPYPEADDLPSLQDTAITATGDQVALLLIGVPKSQFGFATIEFIAERVDPRLN